MVSREVKAHADLSPHSVAPFIGFMDMKTVSSARRTQDEDENSDG
jgi:hypothetical protein